MSEATIAYHSMSIQDMNGFVQFSYQSGFFTHYSLLWLLRLNLVKKMLKHLTTSKGGHISFWKNAATSRSMDVHLSLQAILLHEGFLAGKRNCKLINWLDSNC